MDSPVLVLLSPEHHYVADGYIISPGSIRAAHGLYDRRIRHKKEHPDDSLFKLKYKVENNIVYTESIADPYRWHVFAEIIDGQLHIDGMAMERSDVLPPFFSAAYQKQRRPFHHGHRTLWP